MQNVLLCKIVRARDRLGVPNGGTLNVSQYAILLCDILFTVLQGWIGFQEAWFSPRDCRGSFLPRGISFDVFIPIALGYRCVHLGTFDSPLLSLARFTPFRFEYLVFVLYPARYFPFVVGVLDPLASLFDSPMDDESGWGHFLGKRKSSDTTCHLSASYLPLSLSDYWFWLLVVLDFCRAFNLDFCTQFTAAVLCIVSKGSEWREKARYHEDSPEKNVAEEG